MSSSLAISLSACALACLPASVAWRGIQREGGRRFSHFNCLINVIAKTGITVNLFLFLSLVVVTYLSAVERCLLRPFHGVELMAPILDDVSSKLRFLSFHYFHSIKPTQHLFIHYSFQIQTPRTCLLLLPLAMLEWENGCAHTRLELEIFLHSVFKM